MQENYQDEKQEKKQKLVRNEFTKTGKFGIPLVKKQDIDISKIELWSYQKAKPNDQEHKNKTIHFFTYDWHFENAYEHPEKALEKLDQYYALLTPDFSTYTDMPLALQINSIFKSRWCGAFWQKHELRVIPTMTWGAPESYEFCFDGVERGSVVAVSTYHKNDCKAGFMRGYDKMMEVINPSAIICYDEPFKEMRGNIKYTPAFDHRLLVKQLGLDEYIRRRNSGDLYPSN